MNKELKKAIINFIFDNEKEFQLHNVTNQHFKPYIYNDKGGYLIGGEQVRDFIKEAITLQNKF
jgi:hypothetical protein